MRLAPLLTPEAAPDWASGAEFITTVVSGVTTACEYLADQGLIGKASTAVRLTKKSNVDVQEMAFVHLGIAGAIEDADDHGLDREHPMRQLGPFRDRRHRGVPQGIDLRRRGPRRGDTGDGGACGRARCAHRLGW